MYEYSFNEHLMGTDLSVSLVVPHESLATDIFTGMLSRLRGYEAQFSRFVPDSELSLLNQKRTMVVSPLCITLLHTARTLYRQTDGHFNPLLQIDRLGYTDSYETLGEQAVVGHATPYNTNFHLMEIDEATRTVTLIDDQKLDFGGFLKGYLAENEAKRAEYEHERVHGVIVNIGGDIHTRGRDANEQVFIFDIHNPQNGQSIAIPLENTSLATSGTYKRRWGNHEEVTHHILAKSGTGNPNSDIISASVIHRSGAAAEAYAKTLLSIRPEALNEMAGEEISYILIHNDGTLETAL